MTATTIGVRAELEHSPTVYKVGCRLSDTGLISSIFTPGLSGFSRLYRPGETVTALAAPVFAYQDLGSALEWYKRIYRRLQSKGISIALYKAKTPTLLPVPAFFPSGDQWPLWDDFWWHWHHGSIGSEDDWCGPGERVLRPPKGTVVCGQLMLTERVDVRALLGDAFFCVEG